jgi:hypothetical protein
MAATHTRTMAEIHTISPQLLPRARVGGLQSGSITGRAQSFTEATVPTRVRRMHRDTGASNARVTREANTART